MNVMEPVNMGIVLTTQSRGSSRAAQADIQP